MTDVLPAIFFGHGNPMNAVRTNPYTEAWQRIGHQCPERARSVSIPAHWFVPGTGVTIIHDFGGFSRELYEVQYPAPGDPVLARRVQPLLAPVPVILDQSCPVEHRRESAARISLRNWSSPCTAPR